jgi:hypothetical protein
MKINTPRLRALRVATPPPLQGATPVAGQSPFHGVPWLDGTHVARLAMCGKATEREEWTS